MRNLGLPLTLASTGVLVLFLGARAERATPTSTVGDGGFIELSPDITANGLAMNAGYYLALGGTAVAVGVALWRGTVLYRLLLAFAPAAAALLLVAFYWPPLTAEAYGGHAHDYTQRPFPFARVDADAMLEAERLAPERVTAALRSFEARGVQPLELQAALDRHQLQTHPPQLASYSGPPVLPHRTYVPFFVRNAIVNELYFVVYADEALAAAQLEDARRSRYCPGGSSAFTRHANVIAVVHTCEPGRPLRTGLAQAAAVLGEVGAGTIGWLPALPGPEGSGGLDEVTEQELLEADAETAVEIVRRRLGLDIQVWNGGAESLYLRPLQARAGTVSFEVVVSMDAATARDLVEHNYLSALDCPFNEPPPVLSGRVIVRGATLPGCGEPADRPGLEGLAAEIAAAIR